MENPRKRNNQKMLAHVMGFIMCMLPALLSAEENTYHVRHGVFGNGGSVVSTNGNYSIKSTMGEAFIGRESGQIGDSLEFSMHYHKRTLR